MIHAYASYQTVVENSRPWSAFAIENGVVLSVSQHLYDGVRFHYLKSPRATKRTTSSPPMSGQWFQLDSLPFNCMAWPLEDELNKMYQTNIEWNMILVRNCSRNGFHMLPWLTDWLTDWHVQCTSLKWIAAIKLMSAIVLFLSCSCLLNCN